MALGIVGFHRSWGAEGKTFTPLNQKVLTDLVAANKMPEAFTEAFEHGDELFESSFNEFDGGGAKVGFVVPGGSMIRYTRTPRADRSGTGEWANHFPKRATGPNAAGCAECHNIPFDGSGTNNSNVHRDPLHSGDLTKFIQRNTPHLFAPGALQKLAEEMTADLLSIRQEATNAACAGPVGNIQTRALASKGTGFGSLSVVRQASPGACAVSINNSQVQGVDTSLVVKPFQWKGSVAFLRDFIRGACHNEIGMQPVELTGSNQDGDGDGVSNEMSVGDQTALAVYLASQPRPTTLLELNTLKLLETPLTTAQVYQINRGNAQFTSMGCAACHSPSKTLSNAVFSEPSQMPQYRDAVFPGGQNPASELVSPAQSLKVDLVLDPPDNVIFKNPANPKSNVVFRLGGLKRSGTTGAIVDLFSDLKRHDLGIEVAEPIDEDGNGASVFLTKPLWGIGSTAPYMHSGDAPTLTKAIALHGGEAAASRSNFNAASPGAKDDLIAFMKNLVLFALPGSD